jgi:AraC-like DNA-binding protein
MGQAELEYVEHIREAPILCRAVSIDHSSPHWHYEYEVIFVLRGSITVAARGESRVLEKGDLILLNSREIHSILSSAKGNAQGNAQANLCLILLWSPAPFLEAYGASFNFYLNTRARNPPSPETAAALRDALAAIGLLIYEKPDGYPFALKSGFYKFISLLFDQVRYDKTARSEEIRATDQQLEDFDRIHKYIQDHYKEEIPLDRLSAEVGMSRAKVFKVLKAAGSASVHSLVNYYRVEYAKNLLSNSALTIPYIAAESGFESDSSFYRVFKEVTGLAPNQYRAAPAEKATPLGIQGYAPFRPAEAVQLLREYRAVS